MNRWPRLKKCLLRNLNSTDATNVESAQEAEASSDAGQRLAETRVQDAVELGAEILLTACPLCVLTLEDPVKTSGHEEKIRVMDISELLAIALGQISGSE